MPTKTFLPKTPVQGRDWVLLDADGQIETYANDPRGWLHPLLLDAVLTYLDDVMIAGDDGNPLPLNEVGEICIKGPQVMEGYWNRPEETAKVITEDGWLRTGDMGRMNENGLTFIEDRKKDMILVSGFNVYPNEIEEVAVAHDGVLEAAAVGLPDEKSGEVVSLFVVKKDPSLDEEELKAFCKENLTGYKRPRYIEFRDELPKTNVGKILRRALRDE